MSQGSNAHEQRATRCPVSRLVHSPGPPASVITWKISTRDPGITITGSQLTGMARLPYNRKVDFCCVKLRCRDLCEANQPGACNQAHSSIARFYTLLLTSPVFQSLRAHTQNFTSTLPPPNIFTPAVSISNELLALSCSLHTNIIKNKRKRAPNRKPNNV